MNKRVPLLPLFILFLCMWAGPLFAQDDSLIVRSGFGDPGSSGNIVSIDLKNSVGVGKMQFTLSYDLNLLSVTNVLSTGRTDAMGKFTWSESIPGQVKVFIWDLEGDTIGPGTGSVADFSFDVVSGAPYSTIPLILFGVVVHDAENEMIPTSAVNGVFIIPEPDIVLSSTSHNYGQVVLGDVSVWEVTISNVGTKDLKINYITSSSGEFTVETFTYPQYLPPDSSLDVSLTFAPASTGQKSASVFVVSDDPDEITSTIALSGSGIAPDISVSATSHDFGSVIGYDTETWVLTIYNLGSTASLSVSAISSNNSDFEVTTPTFPRVIPVNGNLEVTVAFTPTLLGPLSGTLTIHSNDPDEAALSITVTGTGYYPTAILTVVGGSGPEDSHGNIVPMDLENDMAVGYVEYTFNYPPSLLTVTQVQPTGRASNMSYFHWSESTPGIVEVLIADAAGSIITTGTGTIFEFFIDVDPGAVPGDAPLVLSDVTLADVNSNPIPVVTENGIFTILPASDIAVSADSLDFGEVLVNDSLGQAFRIYNHGSIQLTVDSVRIEAAVFGAQFPSFPQVIASGDSLEGTLFFKPTALGFLTGTVIIYSDDPNEDQLPVDLSGRGVLPDIDIPSSTIHFGDVWVTDTSSTAVSIFNTGTAGLTIHSIFVSPIQYEVSSDPLPTTVSPGDSFDIILSFHPTAVGQLSGSATIESNDPDEGTAVINLLGTGIDPEIGFSATNHMYGDVLLGESEDWNVAIYNLGLTDLIIDSTPSDHGDFQLMGLSLPYTIPAGDSVIATVRFSPSGIGSQTGNISIYSNDRDESPTLLQVNGIGVVPDIHLSSTTHDFGDVVLYQPSDWILKIDNHDVGNLIVSTVTTNNSNFFIANPDFPDTVVLGDTLFLTVRFQPSKTGLITGIIKVMSNDPDEPQVSISLGGTGVVPDIAVSALTHYFGAGVLCDTVAWVLEVYNVGTSALTIDSVYADTSDYGVIEPAFPQVVPVGDTLEVTVGFMPTQSGSIIGILFILTDDPDEAVVEIGLSGISYAPDIELSQQSHDFGSVPIGYSDDWSVTLSNVGTWPLTIDSAYTSSSDFLIDSPTFPQTVLIEGDLSMTISFAPQAEGLIAANVTLLTDDCDEGMVNILLRGYGYTVGVAVPDTSAMPSQSILIPMDVQNVDGLGIYSWEASLTYDTAVLSAVRATSNGSITQSWGSPTYSIYPGGIDVAMSGIVPLSGAGPLVFITFLVDSTIVTGDSSIIHIEEFRFNDGAPASSSFDGFFYVNRPPVFDLLSDQTAHEGLLLSFVVTASDPDHDPLTFWASNLPTGALFDSGAQTFSWTPGFGSSGTYPGITFYVSDGQFTDSTDITITVESSIRVAVTDTTRPAGVTFGLPIVLLDSVRTVDSVFSLDLTLTYDPDVLTAIGATVSGSLTEDWGTWIHRVTDGQITMGFSGLFPLSGSGVLVYINFSVSTGVQAGDSSVQVLTEFQFNDGDPAAYPLPGVLTIPFYSIGGSVRYYMEHSPGLPIDSVLMEVLGSASRTDISDDEGVYMFAGLVGGLGYAIRPSKDGDHREGIGSFDASLITRYVVGIDPLDEHQQAAADVTGNGRVSAFDASHILQFTVGLIEEFGIGRDWMFLPDQRDYPVLDADHREQDFTGILFGDVSGNWGVPGTGKQVAGDGQWVETPEIKGAPGEMVRLPILLLDTQDMYAVDIDLSFDTQFMQVLEVTRTSLTSDFMLEYNVTENNVKIAMAGATPLRASGEIVEMLCRISSKAGIGDTSPLELRIRLNETWLPQISGTVKATQALPREYALEQNYPNPFNPTTDIRYQIADSGSPVRTSLTIFNVLGQEVRVLVNETQEPGYYGVTWDGRDAFGTEVASGIYFYRLDAGSYMSTKRMMLMK